MTVKPPGRTRRNRRLGRTLTGGALAAASAVGVVAHYRTPHRAAVLAVSAIAPYLMLGAPPALALFLSARRWYGAVAAGVLCGAWITTQGPLFVATSAPEHAEHLTVMTANLHVGDADAGSVVAAVKRHHVDLLMLQELPPDEQQRLSDAGLDDVLPFHISDPRSDRSAGTGLWSRYPLSDENARTDFAWGFVTARVHVPSLPRPFQAAALHMSGPWPTSSAWLRDIDHLPDVLRELATAGEPVIVGGDFNATPDVAQFRRLLDVGYADAAQQAGAGLTATFPADTWWGPVIALDHVLTRNAVATSAGTVKIADTDHRAFVTTVAISTT